MEEKRTSFGGTVGFVLAVTFGFALLMTEVAIGRHTKKSPLAAYGQLKKNWKHFGIISALVPMLILPYYIVIGGWVIKYMVTLLNQAVGQILDILDYVSNYILMPTVSIGTCILIGWVLGPQLVISEAEKNGERMGRKKLYIVMVKYIAPVLLIILLLKSLGVLTVI